LEACAIGIIIVSKHFCFFAFACCTRQGLNKKVHVRRQIVPTLVGFKKQACPCRQQQQGFNGEFFNGAADDARGIQEGFFFFFCWVLKFVVEFQVFWVPEAKKKKKSRGFVEF
jgi:hypothetical protein